MIKISLQYIFEELCVFNKSKLEDEAIRGTIVPMIESIVGAVNSDDPDNVIWDVVDVYERLLKGNGNLESLMSTIYNDIMTYRRINRYDPRLKMKVDATNSLKGRLFVFVVMDLESTLAAFKGIEEDETYPDDMVIENPTPEQLALHEKITH